jgi:hypothetical protein
VGVGKTVVEGVGVEVEADVGADVGGGELDGDGEGKRSFEEINPLPIKTATNKTIRVAATKNTTNLPKPLIKIFTNLL